MPRRDGETWMGGGRGDFTSTLWAIVFQAKDPASPERKAALQKLIETYWKPLYHYVRRRGHDSESGKDIVQGFFTALLDKDLLQYVQPGRAKFRTFLLLALKHHMIDGRDRETAMKRGGGAPTFSMDIAGAEQELEHASPDEFPDQAFRREWALRVLEQALEQVRLEYTREGKREEFEAVRLHLGTDAQARKTYTEIAASMNRSEDDIRNRIHAARVRYRNAILKVIRAYTESEEQVEDELRDLFSAFS